MKKLSLVAMFLAFTGITANANFSETARTIALADLQFSVAMEMHTNNLINWKVGEFQELDIGSSFGSLGKMKKYVASEQGNAIWMNQDVGGGMMGEQKIEVLLDRATGKVLEMKQNGQKQEVPNDKMEVISQDATKVTVPAGTFDVIHIVAKTEKVKKLEVWANPRDITMDGTAQMNMDTDMLPISMKLLRFGGR